MSLLPNCREATRLQSEALDCPLPMFRRLGLTLHLLLCKWCRRYGRQIRFLRAAIRNQDPVPEQPGEPGLSTEARERMKRTLQAAVAKERPQ